MSASNGLVPDVGNDITSLDVGSPATAPSVNISNFDFREGDTYGYISAISEEDSKRGKVAGDVSLFRYTGFWKALHHLELLDADGTIIAVSECADPCRAIKTYTNYGTRRVAYNRSSVIGAAFEDAIAGHLVDARKREADEAIAAAQDAGRAAALFSNQAQLEQSSQRPPDELEPNLGDAGTEVETAP